MSGALVAGTVLVAVGVIAAQPRFVLIGVVSIALAWSGRCWLQHRGKSDAERVVEVATRGGEVVDAGRAWELLSLLNQWEAMEKKRGSAGFDPWALQTLRNDIRKVVQSDPALERLYFELQRAA